MAGHGGHRRTRLHQHDIAVGNEVLRGIARDAVLVGLVDYLLADIERLGFEASVQARGATADAAQPARLLQPGEVAPDGHQRDAELPGQVFIGDGAELVYKLDDLRAPLLGEQPRAGGPHCNHDLPAVFINTRLDIT